MQKAQNSFITLCAVCAALLYFTPGAGALSGGNATADFLKMAADPDSIALGQSIMTPGYSPAGIIMNPSALAYNYQPILSFTNTLLANDVRYNFAGISVPLKLGTVAAAASYSDYGQIQGYDANFNPYNIPRSGETAVILNYALPIRREIPVFTEFGRAGVSVKFVHLSLAGYSADVTAYDIGGSYNMPFLAEGMSAGLVFRNNGGGASYNTTSASLPSSVNFGLRYERPAWKDFFAVADAETDADNAYYSAGVGVSPIYPLSLRCGWRMATNSSAAEGLSVGFGLSFSNFSLRYAMSPMKDISMVHTVCIDITFESFTNAKVAYDHYLSRYYQMGRDKYDEKDYIAARQIFEDILSVYPGHLPSKEYLQKINNALDEMEQHKQVQIDRWLRKADVALQRNDVIEARKYYSLVLNIDSENTEALDGMSKISDLLGDYENEEAEQVNKDRITNLWNTAVGFYAKGDYVVAREKFQEVLRVDPNNEQAAKYLSEIFEQLNKITTTQNNELFNKGVELFGQGNYAEAKKYFSSVVISNPDRKDAQDYIAACQQKMEEQQQKAEAEKTAYKNVTVKNNIETSYFEALKMYQKGDYEEAIKAFTKCREDALRYDFNKYAESSRHYINACKNALSEKYYKEGFSNFKNNNLEAAADSFNKALEYNPEYSSAKLELDKVNDKLAQDYYELGMKAFSAGNTEKAKELFKKSLNYKFDKIESQRALERIQ